MAEMKLLGSVDPEFVSRFETELSISYIDADENKFLTSSIVGKAGAVRVKRS